MVFSPLLFYKNKSIVKGEDGGMYELGLGWVMSIFNPIQLWVKKISNITHGSFKNQPNPIHEDWVRLSCFGCQVE